MPKKEMRGELGRMHRKTAGIMLVLGLLVLANVYWPVFTWGEFIGGVLVLGGLLKLLLSHKRGR
jgi:uncharacterized membrane protein HdeD (DUF308 family)